MEAQNMVIWIKTACKMTFISNVQEAIDKQFTKNSDYLIKKYMSVCSFVFMFLFFKFTVSFSSYTFIYFAKRN